MVSYTVHFALDTVLNILQYVKGYVKIIFICYFKWHVFLKIDMGEIQPNCKVYVSFFATGQKRYVYIVQNHLRDT